MDIKKIVPSNWFSREENQTGNLLANQDASQPYSSLARFHQEIDHMFDGLFRDFKLPSMRLGSVFDTIVLRPKVDIASTDKEYTITIEIPGVNEDDVKLELSQDGILTIKGEKKQEKEQKDKNFYRVERSYGSFQRTLSLPEDADAENINASFKNGILTVSMPRKANVDTSVRRIEIKKAS